MAHFNATPLQFRESPSGCFEVFGHPGPMGYPALTRDGKKWLAHRLIWTECFGDIPDGMCVCHKCDNPKCINPEHLFLGTPKDNVADMWKKGRARTPIGNWHGTQLFWAKLTEQDVADVRRRYEKGHPVNGGRPLAREYGVHQKTMMEAIQGSKWKHVSI